MQPLLIDPLRQEEFERDGYAVLDLIDQARIRELTAFYQSLKIDSTREPVFQVSLDNEDPEFVRMVAERLVGTVHSCIEDHVAGHRIFTASFVNKASNPSCVVPPHQDWTFVDESRFCSATIWCPLIDVDMDSGALGLIKGSHRIYDHIRPSPSPQYTPPFKNQMLSIFPYLNFLDLKAGQAVMFDNRTIHASLPNFSDRTRVAFGIGVTQQEACLRHYFLLPGREKPLMEGYEVQPEFFYTYNNARLRSLFERARTPPGVNSVGVFTPSPKHLETQELLDAIRAAGNREDAGLLHRAARLFADVTAAAATPERADRNPRYAQPVGNPPFWKVYTPANIIRELRSRLGAG